MRKIFQRTVAATRSGLARVRGGLAIIRRGPAHVMGGLARIAREPALIKSGLARVARVALVSGVSARDHLKRNGIKGSAMFVVLSVVHVVRDSARWLVRNWKAMTLLMMSIALLVIGFVRLHDYSVPMLRGDYETAGKGKTEFDFADKDTAPQPAELVVEDSMFNRVVVRSIKLSGAATDTVVGDRRAAKFNHGFELYQATRYEESVKVLTRAYAGLTDRDGNVRAEHAELASKIQFLIGNAHANSNKNGEAISAYTLSLKHDPNNVDTIYNLERLLNDGGKGGNDGDKPKPSNPTNTKL